MKNIIMFFLIYLSVFFSAFGQDSIYVKKSNRIIVAKILEVNSEDIKYKKFSYQDGPTYIINQEAISKIQYQNGDIENYDIRVTAQESINLITNSRVYLEYGRVSKKNNVKKIDALSILRKELKNLTSLNFVNSKEDADFILIIKATKYMITKRKAKIEIKHVFSGNTVYESDWFKGTPSEFNGFSGSRQAIGRVIKRDLLNTYPEVAK